ncbi:MAG: hypothetical protein FJX52_02610 [Alphaproteobacteria bacterium]|nr:hypothetical protein [Alphaproteobacteria bacterium]
MAELPADQVAVTTRALWKGADDILVLVEPGTPDGHRRILEGRTALVDDGATILAPCPYALPCPLTGAD